MKAISEIWRTCPIPALNSSRDLIASLPREVVKAWLKALSDDQARRLLHDFPYWADPAQLPPLGDWLIWLFMGGRGAGKTRAGAEWIRARIAAGDERVALVGPTFSDVREVMIEGPSGLRALGPDEDRPRYEASRKRLVWPNGAVGYAFSAEDPDGLRGPQYAACWGDEMAAWAKPQETLDTLRMGLRLGAAPRLMVSTTPRPIPALKRLLTARGLVVTRRTTAQNIANLGEGFVEAMHDAYGASRLGRQELEGELIADPPGALFDRNRIEAQTRMDVPATLDRLVVAIDPPASSGPRSDECGIIVAGRIGDGAGARAVVLADLSFGPARPADWARTAISAFESYEADCVIAESNQGGEMVASVLHTQAPGLPVRLVHASRGKQARAEPVAALYEAGRVEHSGHFPALVDQMCAFGSAEAGGGSPDRVDALVWAIFELLIRPRGMPRVRPV